MNQISIAKSLPRAASTRLEVKFILPALTEATGPYWRPIKYSLFPPLGLATLAAFLNPDDRATLVDEHVQTLDINDRPDLVVIQVYITSAYRAYRIADRYRAKGFLLCLEGSMLLLCRMRRRSMETPSSLDPGNRPSPVS